MREVRSWRNDYSDPEKKQQHSKRRSLVMGLLRWRSYLASDVSQRGEALSESWSRGGAKREERRSLAWTNCRLRDSRTELGAWKLLDQ